jgi:3-isopropylmalate/(R)-2-methylmalate dehydratase small subunit
MTLVIPEKIIAVVSGRAVPKTANKQNTDDIMPAQFLKEITFRNMGQYVYDGERKRDGETHPFNDRRYFKPKILLAGADYGCGSSREHAPQGLYRWGIQAIVAESFHEIFAGNCAAIGLVGVTAKTEDIRSLAELVSKDPKIEVFVDLCRKEVSYFNNIEANCIQPALKPTGLFSIDLPEGRRQAFLNGTWDAMAVLQANQEDAEKVRARLPYINL